MIVVGSLGMAVFVVCVAATAVRLRAARSVRHDIDADLMLAEGLHALRRQHADAGGTPEEWCALIDQTLEDHRAKRMVEALGSWAIRDWSRRRRLAGWLASIVRRVRQ